MCICYVGSILIVIVWGCVVLALQGIGSSWGGQSAGVLSPPARTMNLEEFLLEAGSCDATVILAADDSLTASGQLQVRGIW